MLNGEIQEQKIMFGPAVNDKKKEKKQVQKVEEKLQKMQINSEYEVEQNEYVMTLFPENFEQIIKDFSKDVFVMFYSNKSESIFKPFLSIAETYKDVEGLIMATFDRNSFQIPGLTQEQMANIEKIMKGEPHFMMFPKENKEGIRFNFENDQEVLMMFLKQKSGLVK